MSLSPPIRKLVVTAHITLAVGWVGAVAAFLALAIAGVTSQDDQLVQSTYVAMALIARYVIVPLSFAPLITGPILALGTPWGLFRHYWILAKLLITVLSTLALLVHMRPIGLLADAAATSAGVSADMYAAQVQMVVASVAALVALLAATALGVYKPRGMTRYGWRKQYEERAVTAP